jgi:D-lactate dehydrogenase (cytochrome)
MYRQSDEQKAREMIRTVQRQGISMGGTVTGEHGIGLEYRDMLVEELGDSSVDAMRQIKLALDPRLLLNPDKIFTVNVQKKNS